MKKIKVNKSKAFSLIEIIVSLAIFAFIFSIVIGISLSLVKAQNRIQEQIFLTQTAQTTLESMSRNLRYGYTYEGLNRNSYTGEIIINNVISVGEVCKIINGIKEECSDTSAGSLNSQKILANTLDSPFILFEGQGGDPTSYADQVAYCYANNKLYKVNSFDIQGNGVTFRNRCDTGQSILPDNIKLEFISFDINGQSSENPKNPIVRIKLELSSESGEKIFMQTSITQRLIQIL